MARRVMNNIKQEYYDGEFEYNGHMIKYHIGDEFKNKKYDNHGQLVKALRYIDFIDETDSKRGGVYPYYDVIEKITNISQWDALDLYKKMCEIEEDKHDR